tara:strand:+ start:335 stop:727 length:393 start_codon:yes stop_codon:yes gene_type:complete
MNKNSYVIMRNQIGYNDNRIYNGPYSLFSNKKEALKAMQVLRRKEGRHPKYAFHVWVINNTLNKRVSVSSLEENKAELVFIEQRERSHEMEAISDEMMVGDLIDRLSKYDPNAKLFQLGICVYWDALLDI